MSKRIEELEKRKKQIEQQLRDARSRDTKKRRAIETRCKIILGSLAIKRAANDPLFLSDLKSIASDRDRAYLDDHLESAALGTRA